MALNAVSGPRLLALADLAHLVLCLCFTPLSTAIGVHWAGYTWDSFHGFVLPHIGLVLLLVALWAGCAARASNARLFRLAASVQPLAALTFGWAMSRWPGGDDGGGMAWGFFVGPATGICLILAAQATLVQRRVLAPKGASGFWTAATLVWAFGVGAVLGVLLLVPLMLLAAGAVSALVARR